MGYPALDVTFTDPRERTLARRIFGPKQYLGQGKETKGIPAGAAIGIRFVLNTGNLNPSGFRVDLIGADVLNLKDLEIRPEDIQLLRTLSGAELKEIPLPAISAASACLEWGIFFGPAVATATSALVGLQLPMGQINRVVSSESGYWVYIPPLKTKDDVDRKVAELEALGVHELFIVQEGGEWRNAISLGIFRTEEGAQAYLTKLRGQGVRLALVERREKFIEGVTFYVREPERGAIEHLARIQRDFPGSELKAAPCPAMAKK